MAVALSLALVALFAAAGTAVQPAAMGNGGSATVFARIPAGQKVPAGTHSDVIVVLVVF